MMYGTYTGWDGNVNQKKSGTETFIKLLCDLFDNAVWNKCSWQVRKMNNPRVEAWSVHGTGRACDFSWENTETSYEKIKEILDFLVFYSDILLIEEIHDYYPEPFGRGWRCDRSKWKSYNRPTIGGAPMGKWFHVEISPSHADDENYYHEAFLSVTGQGLIPFSKSIQRKNKYSQPSISKMLDGYKLPYPDKLIEFGDSGIYVDLIQEKLKIKQTKNFDTDTVSAVKEIQKSNNIDITGIVDKSTWELIFGRTYEYPGYEIGLNHSNKEYVILIQKILNIKADGYYGPKTQDAVKQWQYDHALEFVADGIVGERTWKAMFGS